MTQGAIPVDEALTIARQIAEALEAAHEKGVIHRDLKPGNVMVTPDIVVKVLDFGLARTAEGSPSSTRMPATAYSPTMSSAAAVHSPTIPGAILGTVGYMSPEQAGGKPVDKRSDIFSFGCMLYEMLTGAKPFQGETVADSIAATLHKAIDLERLPPTTPTNVRELLSNCLTKDHRNRLRDIGGVRLALTRAIIDPRGAALGLGGAQARSSRRGLHPALALAIAAVAIVGGTFPLWPESIGREGVRIAASKQVVRFTIEPPSGYKIPTFAYDSNINAIHPAGDWIAFVVEADSKSYLCEREVASNQSRVLPNTEGYRSPFYYPDGKWLEFMSGQRLIKMPAEGGPALMLCDASTTATYTWLDDGSIVWGGRQSGLWRVSANGGEPELLAKAWPDVTTSV